MHVSLHDRVILPDDREGLVCSLHRSGRARVHVRGRITDWIDIAALRAPEPRDTPAGEEPPAEDGEEPPAEDGEARPT